MKRIFYWVMLSMLLTTCQKNSDDTDLALPPYLLLSGHRFKMPATGGSFSVKTYSPTDYSVIISSDCYAWVSETDALPGTSESIRHFNVAANNDRGNRSGYIVFKNNVLQDTVHVIQATTPEEEPKIPEDAVLSLSEHRFELPEEGGEFAVKVECNDKYIVEIPSVFRPWLSMTETNPETGICRFTIATNNHRQPREGYVVFVSEGFMDTLCIIQEPMSIVSNREYEIPTEGGILSVDINTDNYTVEIPAEYRNWIKQTNNHTSNTCHFTVDANSEKQIRVAHIIFRNEKQTDRVYIIQASCETTSFIWGEDFIEECIPGVRLEMVYVQGGTFTMCSHSQNKLYEHSVALSDYYISKFKITQGIWEEIMQTYAELYIQSYAIYNEERIGPNCPMIWINWEDAQEFCKRLSELTGKKYALPTDAQWEFAAIGGCKSKGYKYIGSNDWEESQKIANELGIYNMGQMHEWCQDWYDDSYYDYYRNSPLKDPPGPEKGEHRATRIDLRYPTHSLPEERFSTSCFRVVLLPME